MGKCVLFCFSSGKWEKFFTLRCLWIKASAKCPSDVREPPSITAGPQLHPLHQKPDQITNTGQAFSTRSPDVPPTSRFTFRGTNAVHPPRTPDGFCWELNLNKTRERSLNSKHSHAGIRQQCTTSYSGFGTSLAFLRLHYSGESKCVGETRFN